MGASLRVAFLVAAKDLRQRLRDRTAILVAVVAPLGLAFIFSQLLGGAVDFHATYVVADVDGGELGRVLREDVIGSLADAGVADVTVVPTEAEARAAVEAGSADSAFIIPAGLTVAIQAGQASTVEVVGAKNAGLATEVARAVAQRFADAVGAVQLSMATVGELEAAAGASPAPDRMAQVAAAAQAAVEPVRLVDLQAELRQLSLPSYFAASMAILFLFFSAQVGFVSLFEERRNGTLARILAGPIAPTSVLLGKTLGSFVLAIVSMTILVVATTLAIKADWGPPPGVVLMIVAVIVAAIGITALVTSFTRSAEAAGAANSAVAITLGVLGGTFSPTAQAPEVMETISLFTPHGWFLRGLADMHGASSAWTDALPAVGVLLGIGLLTGAIGFARARRLVTAR
jgi:ABC-2 type transport system permease protein